MELWSSSAAFILRNDKLGAIQIHRRNQKTIIEYAITEPKTIGTYCIIRWRSISLHWEQDLELKNMFQPYTDCNWMLLLNKKGLSRSTTVDAKILIWHSWMWIAPTAIEPSDRLTQSWDSLLRILQPLYVGSPVPMEVKLVVWHQVASPSQLSSL